MSVEENVRIVDAQADAFNEGDLDRCLGFYAESVVRYVPGMPEPLRGRDALREVVETFYAAFPDIHAEKVRSFGQGDWVCRENLVTGTHRGPLPTPNGETIQPKSSPIRIPICHVYRLVNGKIVEDYQYMDMLTLLSQLGAAP